MTLIESLFASAILYLLVLATNVLAQYTGMHHAIAAFFVVATVISIASLVTSIVRRRSDKQLYADKS